MIGRPKAFMGPTVGPVKVFIEFTHENGRRRARGGLTEPLRGELRTHEMRTKTGSYMVATLLPENVTAPALAELYEVRLFLIGPQGMHLRGLERQADGRFVLQGWLVTDQRDHYLGRR